MPTLAEQISPQRKQPEGLGGWLSSIADEAMGAFERYGRRSGAQRDASLALLNQSSAPGTDPIMGAGQKLLGLAGLITHPLAFFPTGDEWRERLSNAGNTGRMGQAIGGMLGDLPSIVDPHLLAGGGALAAAPIVGKLGRGISDLAGDATDAELAALRARLQAEAAQTGGAPSSVSREQALESMVDQPQRRQLTTQSYKETLPDGTEQWVPGTLRVNPPSSRFNSEMSIADIKRYIELYGEPPPPRAKDALITGKRKDVYPDGTEVPVPGLLRTKRPSAPKRGE